MCYATSLFLFVISAEAFTLVGCSAYYFNETSECQHSHMETRFPTVYNLTDMLPPERPRSLDLQIMEKFWGKPHEPSRSFAGVNVMITPPKTASIGFIRGFEIRFSEFASPMSERCIVIELSQTLSHADKDATYWVEVWPVAEGQVTFYVSSLPKAEETTLDMLQTGFVYNRFRGDWSNSSMFWYTTITYKVRNITTESLTGSIEYRFNGAANYSFIAYKVMLFKDHGQYAVKTDTIYSEDVMNSHTFEELGTGTYQIMVTPDNPLNNNLPCKDVHGYPQNCVVTSTRDIVIGDLMPSTTMTSSTESTTSSTTSQSTIQPTTGKQTTDGTALVTPTTNQNALQNTVTTFPESQNKIIAAVLGTVLGMILLVLSAFCAYNRRMNIRRNYTRDDDTDGNAFDDDTVTSRCFGIRNDIKTDFSETKDSPKQGKTILLSYTADNVYHTRAVEKLGEYLQKRLKATIYTQPCPTDSDIEKVLKLGNTIKIADVFVFVCSPDCYSLYKKRYQFQQQNGVVQLFKHLENSDIIVEGHRKKWLFVTFDYKRCEQLIQSDNFYSSNFTMMQDKDKLFKYVSTCLYGTTVAKLCDDKDDKSLCNELEKAIELAIKFNEENPRINIQEQHFDSGFVEGTVWRTAHSGRLPPQGLDSISAIMPNGLQYDLHTGNDVSSVDLMNPEIHLDFQAPSEIVSLDDTSTMVLQNRIHDFNERNLHPDRKLSLLDGELGDERYGTGIGQYDYEECVSIGSGKSV